LYGFINFLTRFPKPKLPLDSIYNEIEFYRKTEYEAVKGKKKVSLEIGKYWPIFNLVYWYHIDGNVIIKENCFIHWLHRRPASSEINEHFLDWEVFAIDMYARLKEFDEYENVLFGDKTKTEFRIYSLSILN
jgi:hypothetical protein